MNSALAERIKRVYPSGVLWERADEQLSANQQNTRIDSALCRLMELEAVRVLREPGKRPSYQFAITNLEDPPFNDWIWSMSNIEKLDWIRRNERLYVVLWLQISRVADYFYWYFNHWTPRGETGYLDADFRRQPDVAWNALTKVLGNLLLAQGFSYATDELLALRVPFVLDHDYDSIPEDDPRWDDDEFKPPLAPVSLHECMFGD